MNCKQPPTPIQTDNRTTLNLVANNILLHCTKAMDMHFWWLRDCNEQDQFKYYWCPGPTNCGKYWTKHHCSANHIKKHSEFLTLPFILDALRAFTNRCPPSLAKLSCSQLRSLQQ